MQQCVHSRLSGTFRLRLFSSGRFDGVLEQLARGNGRNGSIPFDPSTRGDQASTTVERFPLSKSEAPSSLEQACDESDAKTTEADVSSVLDSLLQAQNVWTNGRDPLTASLDDPGLTPAQRFYLENKELLVNRLSEYSNIQARNEWEKSTKDIQDEWAFYRDPIMRPARGKLWPVNPTQSSHQVGDDYEQNKFQSEYVSTTSFTSDIIEMLRREHVDDILSLDLEEVGRRDIGESIIIGTVRSDSHGERVSKMACRRFNSLKLANNKSFSNAAPGQDWIVLRLGSTVIHLMTSSDRNRYNLEDLYKCQMEDSYNMQNDCCVEEQSLEGQARSIS
jgi:ribosomal silencing factor RsfS